MTTPLILMVEDDEDVVKLVKNFARDYDVEVASSLAQATQWLEKSPPALVLLDIELPDGNGVDFLQRHREFLEKNRTGVIMLTGRSELDTKIESFDLGALDYVQKPFAPQELMARIRTNLRKMKPQRQDMIRQDITVRALSGEVYVGGKGEESRVDLSPLELKLLLLFMENEDRIYSRDELMDLIWGNQSDVTDRNVDQHVSKLRKKINSQFFHIKTCHGKGYAWVKYSRP